MAYSRLDNLYSYLIGNRKHRLNGWYMDYKELVEVVSKIRDELHMGKNLTDNSVYADTIFNNGNPFESFMNRLIKMGSNGISSSGQSILSQNDFDAPGKFKNNQGFIEALENLIKTPNFTTYDKFKTSWKAQKTLNNKLLINRTAAACTLSVSSTVDEGKFNQLFIWMTKEGLIEDYNGGDNWFEKNQFVNREMDKNLTFNRSDEYWRNIFIWELYSYIGNPFNLKRQIIKYGAPGTGKTFGAKQEALLHSNIWETEFLPGKDFSFDKQLEVVQFHPSYSYEDFIEGLRPVLKDGKAELSLQNGIFKTFCKGAGQWELDIYDLIGEEFDWLKSTIKDLANNENLKSLREKSHWHYIFDQKNKEKRLVDSLPPYFFIIDEINRAELSSVLGELMYCLENRGIKGRIKTQYANLNTDETGFLKVKNTENSYQFFIPQNVYVIGTMNTIDRSVESFDFALRRRFIWKEVEPDIEMLRSYLKGQNIDWTVLADDLKRLNDKIKNEILLGKDFCIGHSYLMNLPYKNFITVREIRNDVWSDSIKPLLEEYLRGSGKTTSEYAKAFGINL